MCVCVWLRPYSLGLASKSVCLILFLQDNAPTHTQTHTPLRTLVWTHFILPHSAGKLCPRGNCRATEQLHLQLAARKPKVILCFMRGDMWQQQSQPQPNTCHMANTHTHTYARTERERETTSLCTMKLTRASHSVTVCVWLALQHVVNYYKLEWFPSGNSSCGDSLQIDCESTEINEHIHTFDFNYYAA